VFRNVFTIAAALLSFAVTVPANANPTQFDFEFSGTGGTIGDFSVQWFPADPSDGIVNGSAGDASNIDYSYLELEIADLNHESPMDLNIFLLDPFGNGIELIDDNGGQAVLSGATLVFSDKGPDVLPIGMPFVDGSSYIPLGPGAFSDVSNTGTAPWRLVVIDDAQGGSGSFDSFTLRGVVVPEPATLSLLAIGTFAAFRRRRNR